MVLTWGADFTQIYNDAYSKLIGDRHPAGLGHDIRITLAEAWDTLGPMIDRVMASGLANWTPALPLEMHRSGYREEAYFSVSHAPAEDDEGRIVGMLAVCSEVTDQLLSERRLRLLRDLGARAGEARETAEAARDLIATMQEHTLDVPFALLYLRDGDELVLTAHYGLPDGSAAAPERVGSPGDDRLWSLGRALSGEVATTHGVEQQVAVSGGPYADPVTTALTLPIRGAHGDTLGVLVAGTSPNWALDDAYGSFFELLAGQVSVAMRNARAREDERRRAEELAALDHAKTTFFSNVSHEFRTPLTLLLGPLEEALGDTPERLASHREALEMAHRNGLRLLRLVNALLDFSRVESDRATINLEPVDLASLTADLASNFRSAMERAGLTFTVDTQPLPGAVLVDRDMYEKILLNLLSNAFKFTHEGFVQLRLRQVGADVELTVADSGTGIPGDELPRVFERFHRIEGQRARSHEGTGIGLALVRQLVELQGGSISVESEGSDRGTSFTVRLPLRGGDEHAPAHSSLVQPTTTRADAYVEEALRWLPDDASGTPQHATGAGRRVLLVDDNADMRAYVGRLLREDGFEVTAVADGAEALAEALRSPPDLVLSDIMMPGLDGFALLRALRANASTAAVPVIFLSARAGEDARVQSLAAGADDHIVKPFGAQELRARAAAAIRLADTRGQAAARERVLEATLAVSQAEAALARSEEQLRTLADALPVLILHIDHKLRYRFVNRTYADWLGQRREEVVGQRVADVVGEPLFAVLKPKMDAVLAGEYLSFEHNLAHPDGGGERHVRAEYVPQFDTDGAVIGFYALVQDISEMRRQAGLLADSERRMRTVLEAVSEGFFAIDAGWRITLFNRAAELHFGRLREEVLGQVVWEAFPQALGTAQEENMRRAMTERAPIRFEAPSIRQADRFVETRIAPKEGGGIAVSFSDVTERVTAARHRELLMDELNHRVKNTLAVVQSIATQSFKGDAVPAAARKAFEGRLMALSDAHNLLTQESWDSAPLRRIVGNALRAFADAGRFRFDGPDLRVGPKAAVSLTLALHELCTNAAKYGALSVPEGQVSISCAVSDSLPRTFRLEWREVGGPAVSPPDRRGFGSRLVQQGLAAELGGDVELSYPVGGVICAVTAPLANVEER